MSNNGWEDLGSDTVGNYTASLQYAVEALQMVVPKHEWQRIADVASRMHRLIDERDELERWKQERMRVDKEHCHRSVVRGRPYGCDCSGCMLLRSRMVPA